MKGLVPVLHHSMFADFPRGNGHCECNQLQHEFETSHHFRPLPQPVLIQWPQRRDLLANPLHCAPCNQGMELIIQRNDIHVDGFQW